MEYCNAVRTCGGEERVEMRVASEMISIRHQIYVVPLKHLMQPRDSSRLKSKLLGLS